MFQIRIFDEPSGDVLVFAGETVQEAEWRADAWLIEGRSTWTSRTAGETILPY